VDIFVVDGHILFREGLVKLLDSHKDFTVIGDASSTREALRLLKRRKPELILIGVDSQSEDEIEAIKEIYFNHVNVKVALLYNHEPDELLLDAIQWGVVGFISKRTSVSSVYNSISALMRGETVIPRKFTPYLLQELVRLKNANRSYRRYSWGTLETIFTPRELEVLTFLGTGATNQDIANGLSISINTVRVHVHNILDKLQLQNRSEAGGFAIKQGLTNGLKGV
jgi:DNA-binding NarL/FixJ family response regulator